MRSFLLFFVALVALGCSSKVSPDALHKLNGYWEIESVKNPDGKVKDYTISESIDYIEWKDGKGYRQKMIQQLEGKFQSNGIKETLTLLPDSKATTIECQTTYAHWKEEILTLSDTHFSIKNEQDFIYTYKKYTPLAVSHE